MVVIRPGVAKKKLGNVSKFVLVTWHLSRETSELIKLKEKHNEKEVIFWGES